MPGILARLLRRRPATEWLEVDELRRRLARPAAPLVIDVRGADEFDGPLGHIEGARNIPLGEVAAHHAEFAAGDQPIVFVCLTDKRSARAAEELAAMGIKGLAVLRGGMTAWNAAGS